MVDCKLIDGSSFVFRAFYALPQLTREDGHPVGAVYGFCSMLLKLLAQNHGSIILVAFDLPKPTFRHILYPDYKAQRGAPPPELPLQWPLIYDACKVFNLPILSQIGFEADDLIASYAQYISRSSDYSATIVSADKDLMQLLVLDKVKMWDPIKQLDITSQWVNERYGILPEQLGDLLALAGDSSDNLPGISGVGPKTAAQLLNQFKNIAQIYQQIETISKPKLKQNLLDAADKIQMFKELVSLKNDLPVDQSVLKQPKPYWQEVAKFFKANGFHTLLSRIPNHSPRQNVQPLNQLSQINGFYVALEKTETGFLLQTATDNFLLAFEGADEILKVLFENPAILKIFPKSKPWLQQFPELQSFADLELMAYLSQGPNFSLPDSLLRSYAILQSDLQKAKLLTLYYQIEKPLLQVLIKCENEGMLIDEQSLDSLGGVIEQQMQDVARDIYQKVGVDFNLASPKQLAHILFDKMGLPSNKKRSTDSQILEELELIDPLVTMILNWRSLHKLYTTYVQGLKNAIKDSKIHTSFLNTKTNTGRLSSVEPNLQNIPIRKALGSQIRKIFCAPKGYVLLSLDYSQIELRLLAHLAKEEHLIQAFLENKDIHTSTAQKIFQTNDISSELRRAAKAINFGIIYGMGAKSLAHTLRISFANAQDYIEQYFKEYPGIQAYQEQCIEFAQNHGFVRTIMGRKCFIPAPHTPFGKRQAMNAPLQGSNADIIKMAMLKTDHVKLLLQVHDELLFQVQEENAKDIAKQLQTIMENIIQLSVELKVDYGIGKNWYECFVKN